MEGAVTGLFYGDAGQFVAEVIGIVDQHRLRGRHGRACFWVVGKVLGGNRVSLEDEVNGLDMPEMGVHGYSTDLGPLPVGHAHAARRRGRDSNSHQAGYRRFDQATRTAWGPPRHGAALFLRVLGDDMIAQLLVALIVLLAAAKLGGALAERLASRRCWASSWPACSRCAAARGFDGLTFVAHDQVVEALAELGVILLLFEVGLSTRLADLMKVGLSAFLVALIGVRGPDGPRLRRRASGSSPASTLLRATLPRARRSARPASASPPACSGTWGR